MKIVAITSHNIISDFSGTPKHVMKLVSCLAKNGCEVIVLYLTTKNWSTPKMSTHQAEGVIVYEISPLLWVTASLSRIKDFKADACIAFTVGGACRILPVLALYNLPLLYEVHTVFEDVSLKYPVQFIYEQMEKIVCKRANHIITLGSKVKELYSTSRRVPSENISIIYPSVNVDDFYNLPSNAEMQHEKKSLTVTYIGNLIFKNQGINLLLKAASIVCSQTKNIQFVLAGQPKEAELSYKDELCSIQDKVKFVYLKNADDVPEIISQSDILAHTRPYCHHNLSVQSKLAIYMAAGKPIVATDFADYQYLIGERGCGYAVKPTPECVAEAIIKLSMSTELRQKMGLNSYKTALEYFNFSTNINKYVSLLDSVKLLSS